MITYFVTEADHQILQGMNNVMDGYAMLPVLEVEAGLIFIANDQKAVAQANQAVARGRAFADIEVLPHTMENIRTAVNALPEVARERVATILFFGTALKAFRMVETADVLPHRWAPHSFSIAAGMELVAKVHGMIPFVDDATIPPTHPKATFKFYAEKLEPGVPTALEPVYTEAGVKMTDHLDTTLFRIPPPGEQPGVSGVFRFSIPTDIVALSGSIGQIGSMRMLVDQQGVFTFYEKEHQNDILIKA